MLRISGEKTGQARCARASNGGGRGEVASTDVSFGVAKPRLLWSELEEERSPSAGLGPAAQRQHIGAATLQQAPMDAPP
jgi:hypothetical protein